MKKYLLGIVLIFINLIIPGNVYATSTAHYTEGIDINRDGNLTLNYYYDDYIFDNTNVKIYYIAFFSADFKYQLSSDFSSYPIEINNITTNEEWISLEETLNAYIENDNINETSSYTIQNNQVTISNLKTGLYFIKTDKITTKDYTLVFDEFLINIPTLDKDRMWNYEVHAIPKIEKKDNVVTNTISNYPEKNPTTYDDIKLYLYLFIAAFIVIILLIISLINLKNHSNKK